MAREARSSLWGWTVISRFILAGSALLFAVGLITKMPPSVREPAIDPTLVVDPNTTPAEVLLALPRLGPVIVGRIVLERERQPFRSLDDLDARVRGVGPATIASLRPHLRFGQGELASTP